MSWRLAKSLETLRAQVNAKWPNRRKDWDGSIGDAAHAARTSDHNPWFKDANSVGVVTAIDLTHDPAGGFNSYIFADLLREKHDPRIKYIISNHRIANPDVQGNKWRPYTGTNPHDHHVHISVKGEGMEQLYDSTKPWVLDDLPAPADPPAEAKPVQPLLKLGSTGKAVEYLQRMLGIPVTGMFDIPTEKAVQTFQARYDLLPDGKVGPYTWRQLEA